MAMGFSRKLAILALVLGLSAVGFAQTAGKTAPPKKRSKASKPSAARLQPVPPPAMPPAPRRPYEMPPVPPQVTYEGGKLSIVAENSTLSAILQQVQARTGAQVEVPAGANERVAVRLGPGNPRDVLSSLLEGSPYDYIVLGSAADPNALSQVILTAHSGAGPTPPSPSSGTSSAVMGGGAPEQPSRPIFGGAGRPEMRAEEEEEPAEAQPAPQPEPGAGVVQPTPVPPANAPGSMVTEPQTVNPQRVKSPQELLQELQRMRQQQQQQPPRQ